jgi:ABC-type molybdate transport system substrate-binding protein
LSSTGAGYSLKTSRAAGFAGPGAAQPTAPDLVYVAGAPDLSEQPIAAKALIDFLADPKAAAVYKTKGLQPG